MLTLLALPSYEKLLYDQPYASRRSVAHAVVASVLKNETVIDSPEDVKGVLELCHVLVRDQKDRPAGPGRGAAAAVASPQMGRNGTNAAMAYDREEMAEEQGWIARIVHLFRAEDLGVQFSVRAQRPRLCTSASDGRSSCQFADTCRALYAQLLQAARREFTEGGDRIRWTFPPLIVAAIKLSRRYKQLQSTRNSLPPDEWEVRLSAVFKFIHQCTSILYNKVESASDICLRLYLLALAAADETGQEELAYEFAVQAFTIYEESISESKAQLQAITAIIGALQVTRVFGEDNYDTLITKAALHGAKLLKKGQQATAVALASHLWWQMELPGRDASDSDKVRLFERLSTCVARQGLLMRHLALAHSRRSGTASASSSACKRRSGSRRLRSTS